MILLLWREIAQIKVQLFFLITNRSALPPHNV